MIRAQNLTKKFGPLVAVDKAEFQVDPDSITGFIGPNGSGKTTVLRMICGLIRPSSGDLKVAGKDPVKDSLAVRKMLSYLPGENSIYLHLKGSDFLEFLRQCRRDKDENLSRSLREFFHLPLERKIRTYSAGMKQKLALLAALEAPVSLTLLDEPTRTLDATMRAQFLDSIELLRERGRTIFLSSHHLADIEKVCDKVIFLLDGKVVPPDRIDNLKMELSRVVRIRLMPGHSIEDLNLPSHVSCQKKVETYHLTSNGDPREISSLLERKPVSALSWGHVELEEIYRLLYLDNAGMGGSGHGTTCPYGEGDAP